MKREIFQKWTHCYYGNSFSNNEILKSLNESKIKFKKFKNIEKIVAEKLSKGKIVGWFQGRSEVGARALGNRSILANPLMKNMKKNLMMKLNIEKIGDHSAHPLTTTDIKIILGMYQRVIL